MSGGRGVWVGARVVAPALLLTLGAAPLAAQTVGGIVVDRRTGGVVENATVALRNAADSAIAYTRSDSLGVFYLGAPGPGTYTLRFNLGAGPERISPPIMLASAEAFHQNRYVVEVPDDLYFFEFQVEQPVEPLRSFAPTYPPQMLQEGMSGDVLVQFVVDTTGRMRAGTLKAIKYTHAAFFRAVQETLPRMRYRPAEIGGRTVPQLVQQTFAFNMGPSIPSMRPPGDPWPPPLPPPPRRNPPR